MRRLVNLLLVICLGIFLTAYAGAVERSDLSGKYGDDLVLKQSFESYTAHIPGIFEKGDEAVNIKEKGESGEEKAEPTGEAAKPKQSLEPLTDPEQAEPAQQTMPETSLPDFNSNPSINANANPPVPDQPAAASEEPANNQGMTKYLDRLVLVNKANSLPADFVPPDLVKPDIPFSFQADLPKKHLRREAAQAISRLISQAQRENIQIYGVSAYRSYQTQKDIFTRKATELGEKEANRLSAYPGQSEHQTGLAIDLSSSRVGFELTQNFGSTPEGRWLSQNAASFGFIIRYPAGKEHLTGYSYEPWHLRYVGVEAAQVIADKKIVLEEYLRDYPSPNW